MSPPTDFPEIGAIHAVEVSRLCVWTADLPGLLPDHEALEADVVDLLARGVRNPSAYGDQTATVLHQLGTQHWKRFFSAVRAVIEQIIAGSPAVLDEATVHLRAWASRLSQAGHYSMRDLKLSALHNHSPALLSAVYYLRLPDHVSDGNSGTFFVNPFPHALTSPHPGVVISPAVGRIVVFPSWLMHGPALLEYTDATSPRIVIAVDAHFVPQ